MWNWRRSLLFFLVCIRSSIGVNPVTMFGTQLYMTVYSTAKYHREISSTPRSLQLNKIWIINVQSMYNIFWITLSAWAFWCCAPTPKNWNCPFHWNPSWKYQQSRLKYHCGGVWFRILDLDSLELIWTYSRWKVELPY